MGVPAKDVVLRSIVTPGPKANYPITKFAASLPQVRFLHGAFSFDSGLSGTGRFSVGLTTSFPAVNKITTPSRWEQT
jgi:hypothetical protein